MIRAERERARPLLIRFCSPAPSLGSRGAQGIQWSHPYGTLPRLPFYTPVSLSMRVDSRGSAPRSDRDDSNIPWLDRHRRSATRPALRLVLARVLCRRCKTAYSQLAVRWERIRALIELCTPPTKLWFPWAHTCSRVHRRARAIGWLILWAMPRPRKAS